MLNEHPDIAAVIWEQIVYIGYCDVNTTRELIERQTKYHRTKQKCVALELSANIFSIVLKYLICLPGG